MDMPNVSSFANMGNVGEMLNNLKGKIDYPVKKEQIISIINDIPNIPEPVKKLIESKLPDGEYRSLDDIKNAVHL
jgi:hypothetical protein